ncbi:hypothetical protein [Nostoc sp.]|uniref:hypothetical protein n=1 Tax=Nostoc sp. TaxID=1180 RepID=UPI002FF5297B
MDWHQQREQDLIVHIDKDLELQNELENKLRNENDPKEKAKIKSQIKDIEESIVNRHKKINIIIQERQEQKALISQQMPSVTFYELEIVIKAIIAIPINPSSPETNFALTNPTEKISKNRFTDNVLFPLTMGMAKVWEVDSFVNMYATFNSSFPEKLKAGFIQEHNRLISDGFDGDALFDALCKFSSGNSTDIKLVSAGLAVLSYLFWKCEVFDR